MRTQFQRPDSSRSQAPERRGKGRGKRRRWEQNGAWVKQAGHLSSLWFFPLSSHPHCYCGFQNYCSQVLISYVSPLFAIPSPQVATLLQHCLISLPVSLSTFFQAVSLNIILKNVTFPIKPFNIAMSKNLQALFESNCYSYLHWKWSTCSSQQMSGDWQPPRDGILIKV